MAEPAVIEWLLAGDPSIRWQVMQDLLPTPPEQAEQERAKVAAEGWGAELLARQNPDGNWGKGVYNPKWTSTTYTLLHLRQLGLPAGHPQALAGCDQFYFRGLEKDGGINLFKNLSSSETCINGMMLALLAYFRHTDPRVHSVAEFLLREQMPDGGWNCRRIKGDRHASFHTTLSVLEGLAEYARTYPEKLALILPARSAAHEFLLQHRLYKSHRTGSIVHADMTRMFFPPRWRCDFLRALDYFQWTQSAKDERMQDAIDLLLSKRGEGGTWVLNKPWSGVVYFHMEKTGQPSRWNTLRALRVLKWWNGN